MTTPAGWYDDPDHGGLLRWWDGHTWSAETRHQQSVDWRPLPAGAPRPRLGTGWFRLATALETTLRLLALGNLAFVAVDLWGLRMLGSWEEDQTNVDLNEAELFDAVTVWSSLGLGVLSLLCLVLMIVWLYRGHRSDRVQPDNLQHRSGWAIGGWFVPILALWRPVQMVLDLRRGLDWSAPSGLVLWWWWSFLIGSLLQRIATARASNESPAGRDYLDSLQGALQFEIAATIITVAAAVLGALVVRSTTKLAAHPPHAPTPAAAA